MTADATESLFNFTSLGFVDTNLRAKPALTAWDELTSTN